MNAYRRLTSSFLVAILFWATFADRDGGLRLAQAITDGDSCATETLNCYGENGCVQCIAALQEMPQESYTDFDDCEELYSNVCTALTAEPDCDVSNSRLGEFTRCVLEENFPECEDLPDCSDYSIEGEDTPAPTAGSRFIATVSPTSSETDAPTEAPVPDTSAPTAAPTDAPVTTMAPTSAPTPAPLATSAPTVAPTIAPTTSPISTGVPTPSPSVMVDRGLDFTSSPTTAPTAAPTSVPSASPTTASRDLATNAPGGAPTDATSGGIRSTESRVTVMALGTATAAVFVGLLSLC